MLFYFGVSSNFGFIKKDTLERLKVRFFKSGSYGFNHKNGKEHTLDHQFSELI